MLKSVFLFIITVSFTFSASGLGIPLDGPLAIKVQARNASDGIVNPGALDSFFGQLAAIEAHTRNRPVRIMQYGDSHTKAGLFTSAVQAVLESDVTGSPSVHVRNTSYSRGSENNNSIVYQALGVNGARLTRLREMTENNSFLGSIAQSRPDLVVIAYGTNEVTDGNWTIESYEHMLAQIITRIRYAAPEASILVIGPPDRSVGGPGGWASVKKIPLLLEAQRRAAIGSGAAFWSEYDAMGGAGSMNSWVARGFGQGDHVHCTAAGYYRLGGMLAAELIDAYRNGPSEAIEPLNGLDLRVMRGVPLSSKTAN